MPTFWLPGISALTPDYSRRKQNRVLLTAPLLTAPLLTAPLLTADCLLRIISALPASHRICAINVDADGAPRSVAYLIRGAVGQSIDGAEVGNHAIISTGEVFQFFAFIESSAPDVRHLFHPIVREIESFLLNIERAQGLIALCVSPDRINHAIKFSYPPD